MRTSKQICPMCSGSKIIPGRCECNMEWRVLNTTKIDDCRCTEDEKCALCNGNGYIVE